MDLSAELNVKRWKLFRHLVDLDASTMLVSNKRRLLQADKVLCESVLQAIMSSQNFRLSSLNGMKAVQAGWTNSPWPCNSMKACQTIFTEACTNKQGSLNKQDCATNPAQIGSGYTAALMCMLHESLACVWSVTTTKKWHGRPVDTTAIDIATVIGMLLVWGDLWVLRKRQGMVLYSQGDLWAPE